MDIIINHFNFNSRHHDKCKTAVIFIRTSNLFSEEVVQKCRLCVIPENWNGVCEMSQETLTLGPVYTIININTAITLQ